MNKELLGKILDIKILIILATIFVIYSLLASDGTIYRAGTNHIIYQISIMEKVIESLIIMILGYLFLRFHDTKKVKEEIEN